METSNSAPITELSGANSSVGNLTNQSQIFIHPEHEAGYLKVPSDAKTRSSRLRVEIFLSIMIFISIITIALLAFIVLPRFQTVLFANSAREVVSNSSEKIDKVSSSLDLLYKSLTNQKSSDITVSDNSVSADFVLGIKTKVSENVSSSALVILDNLKENFEKNSKVKAFSVPRNDPNKEIRDQRAISEDISKKVVEAQKTNKQLLELKEQNLPKIAQRLQSDISNLESKNTQYTIQADKTSKYYVDLSDATMTLNNLALSITTTKDLDAGISTLTTLKSKFENLKKTSLPDGIESYNKDIVGVFDLLLNFYKQIKSGQLSTLNALNKASANFFSELKALSVTSATDQLNFWQGNPSLSKGDDLTTDHLKLLTQVKNVKEKNNLFLLNWVGVN